MRRDRRRADDHGRRGQILADVRGPVRVHLCVSVTCDSRSKRNGRQLDAVFLDDPSIHDSGPVLVRLSIESGSGSELCQKGEGRAFEDATERPELPSDVLLDGSRSNRPRRSPTSWISSPTEPPPVSASAFSAQLLPAEARRYVVVHQTTWIVDSRVTDGGARGMAKAKEQVRAFGYVRLSKYDGESIFPTPAARHDRTARGRPRLGARRCVRGPRRSAFKKVKRPGLEAMLGRLDETDAVITYRIDRLARSSRQFGELLETFAASKVQFVATDLHVDDTASGRLIRDMMARLAEFESDNISQRSRAMMAHKRTNGEWVGRIPFGWTVRDKHLVPDKAEQAVLRDAARSYVKGESFVSIARRHGMQSGPLQRILTSERVLTALGRNLAGQLTG